MIANRSIDRWADPFTFVTVGIDTAWAEAIPSGLPTATWKTRSIASNGLVSWAQGKLVFELDYSKRGRSEGLGQSCAIDSETRHFSSQAPGSPAF